MNVPKSQHYLPVSYLNGFSKDGSGELFVYNRMTNSFFSTGPKGICAINHFYSLEDRKTGVYDTSVEEYFAKEIEPEVPQLIEKIGKEAFLVEDVALRIKLSRFIAFLHTRTPTARIFNENLTKQFVTKGLEKGEELEAAYREGRLSEKVLPPISDGPSCSLDELRAFAESRKDEPSYLDQEAQLRHMIGNADAIWKFIAARKWFYIHAGSKKSFITTDNPVMLVPTEGHPKWSGLGFGLHTTDIWVPLNQNVLLVMTWTAPTAEDRHIYLPDKDIRTFNLGLTGGATDFVVGRDDALVKSLVNRTNLANRKDLKSFLNEMDEKTL